MKILVLSKRQYMAKDLLDDRFGRFHELPLELAKFGHEVQGICLSYRPKPEGWSTDFEPHSHGEVPWLSLNLGRMMLPGIKRYLAEGERIAADFHPDIIWSCSDAFHAIFGARVARRAGALSIIDLYDNFEAFRASRIPGVIPLFRRAVRDADGLTVFSRRLGRYVVGTYGYSRFTDVIENGVKSCFRPQNRAECRRRLGLPQNARIIGTAGALYKSRGIETLFRAFEQLAVVEDLHLALAGARTGDLKIPPGERVHDLGELPHEEVAVFFNALDIAVVCYRHSPQGEVSLPQKAYEIIACGVPMIAAAVGTMSELLESSPECLYAPESSESLAAAVRYQLERKVRLDIAIPSWAESAWRLSEFFTTVAGSDDPGIPALL
ncbi:MAG TPA: glycosyltransferase [Candidatus Binatia bacterium]|jgi:glycosyltransferase involved in cell wall biosynthesis